MFALTVNATAEAAGLVKEIRSTKVMPATYVPLPVCTDMLAICKLACAFTAKFKLLVMGPNARPVYSSVPVIVAVTVIDGWLGAPAAIVSKKSMYPVVLTVLDAEALAENPVAPLKFSAAVTERAFA